MNCYVSSWTLNATDQLHLTRSVGKGVGILGLNPQKTFRKIFRVHVCRVEYIFVVTFQTLLIILSYADTY